MLDCVFLDTFQCTYKLAEQTETVALAFWQIDSQLCLLKGEKNITEGRKQ